MKCLHRVVKPDCKRKHANVQCTVHWCSCQCDRANNSVFSEQAMYTESAMWSLSEETTLEEEARLLHRSPTQD